jgi:SAM-dependent methyltransferase
MFPRVDGRGGWETSAEGWLEIQGDDGDWLRKWVLDDLIFDLCTQSCPRLLLDVGCGDGRFARKLEAAGVRVVGVDPIHRFLQRAHGLGDGEFVRSVAEKLPFLDEMFDLVLSYVTLVDMPDYRSAIREMARVLLAGGRIVVATISPFTSSTNGWVKDEEGRKLFFPVDRYLEETEQTLAWKGIQIVNYHRPMSAIMEGFLSCGLILEHYLEPRPIEGAPREEAEDYVRAPYATVLVWKKP